MNPEKSGLKFEPIFHDALSRAAAADGTTFDRVPAGRRGHLRRCATSGKRRRKPVITPDRGFAPAVRKTDRIASSALSRAIRSISKWRRCPKASSSTSTCGKARCRSTAVTARCSPQRRQPERCAGAQGADVPADAPRLRGSTLRRSKDKDEIALWKSILGAAVEPKSSMRGE